MSVLESSDAAVRRGALNAVWHAAMGSWAEVGRFLGPVRDFLGRRRRDLSLECAGDPGQVDTSAERGGQLRSRMRSGLASGLAMERKAQRPGVPNRSRDTGAKHVAIESPP